MFLKKLGVSAEIVTLGHLRGKKWEATTRLEENVVDDTRVLVWPSHPIGRPLRIALGQTLNIHFFPTNIAALNEYLNHFDVLHLHDVVDLTFPLSCLRSKKPRILSCHTLQELQKYYQSARSQVARSLLIRSADLFHVFSNADAHYLEALGVDKRAIRVVSHGVDIERFRPRANTTPRDCIRIIRAGRISRIKGVAKLLEAVHILKQHGQLNKRIEVLIGGDVWDPAYYRELLEYTKRTRLDEVTFVGFIENLSSWLREGDIFVCPSLSETFAIVNLEAMASGLPVIATSVGAIPDVVVEGQTGFLVPANDAEALAQRICCLVNDDHLRVRMGQMGRLRAESFFSMDRIAAIMSGIYHELAPSA